jgi:hypothetical protein
MEVTPARKLSSYFVSFILLFLCKYSYDVHRQRIEMQNQPVFVQPEKPLPIEVISPQQQKTEPLQSGESPDDLYVVKDGKTLHATPAAVDKEPELTTPVLAKMHYSDDVEVHAVGIFQGECKNADISECSRHSPEGIPPTETVTINVSASSHPIILTLMSHWPVLWNVNVSNGAVIEQIILAGFFAQEVTGLDKNIPVMVYTYRPSPCTNCYHGADYFESNDLKDSVFINRIFEITGKKVSTFQASHKGSVFNILDNMPKLEYQQPVQETASPDSKSQ